MDISSITTLLGSLKTATDLAKLINDSGITLEKAEVKLKLAELISALAEAKIETAAVQQTILDRDQRIRELEAERATAEKLQYKDPAYWLQADGGDQGPYCQTCYDTSIKLVRLQDVSDGAWACRACNVTFFEPARRARDEASFSAPIKYPRSGY